MAYSAVWEDIFMGTWAPSFFARLSSASALGKTGRIVFAIEGSPVSGPCHLVDLQRSKLKVLR